MAAKEKLEKQIRVLIMHQSGQMYWNHHHGQMEPYHDKSSDNADLLAEPEKDAQLRMDALKGFEGLYLQEV